MGEPWLRHQLLTVSQVMSNKQNLVPGFKLWGLWIRQWGTGDAKVASAPGRIYPLGSVVKYLPKMLPLMMLAPVYYTCLGGTRHLLLRSSGPLSIPPSLVWWVNRKAHQLY